MSTGVASIVKEIYREMVEFQYPEEVRKYGHDAVWEALENAGPVCSTDGKNGCGCSGCHFDCGCLCS